MAERTDRQQVRCDGGPCPYLMIYGPELPETVPVVKRDGLYRLDLTGKAPVYRWES